MLKLRKTIQFPFFVKEPYLLIPKILVMSIANLNKKMDLSIFAIMKIKL